MQEEWRDIGGYEGLYQVSNLGRVKSLNYKHTGIEKILKPSVDKKGYLFICLYKNSVKKRNFKIHRLVAEAFISNPNNLPQVNHKNEIKDDNRVDNLEWCDAKYNNNYGTRLERVAEKTTNGKLSKPVLQINPNTNEVIAEFPSINEVERQLGFGENAIIHCCKGRTKTSCGFKWQYK